jgi:hypothetical protein
MGLRYSLADPIVGDVGLHLHQQHEHRGSRAAASKHSVIMFAMTTPV